jgi:galactose mutarotase-like enzyme
MLNYTKEQLYEDYTALILENEYLKIMILPEYGGNIWGIDYKPKSLNLLWQDPSRKPFKVSKGMTYDDVFFGGWHDIFPNDREETVDNKQLLDHGELWFLHWDYNFIEEENCIRVELETESPLSKVILKKTISLGSDKSYFNVHYSIKNIGESPMDYMLKIHAAFKVNEEDKILLNAAKSYVVPANLVPRVPENTIYSWPYATRDNIKIDMAKIPSNSSGFAELQCHSNLSEGFCGLVKEKEGIKVQFHFEREFFPTVWTFGTYGGWRKINTLILEPATGYTLYLNEAKKLGKRRILQAGQEISTSVRCIVSMLEEDYREQV